MSFLLETVSSRAAPSFSLCAVTSKPTIYLRSSRIAIREKQRSLHVTTARREKQQSPVERIIDEINAKPTSERNSSKVYKSADDAVADLQDGVTILSSGFGLCGVAGMIICPLFKALFFYDAGETTSTRLMVARNPYRCYSEERNQKPYRRIQQRRCWKTRSDQTNYWRSNITHDCFVHWQQ